jgi:ubiquinol-cytochrome c reductase iron-sulfur subunit
MGGEATMTRHRAPLGLAAAAIASLVLAGILLATGAGDRAVALAGGSAAALAGAALVRWAHEMGGSEPDVEERTPEGPGSERRRTILRWGLGAATLTVAGVAIPAARRIERSVDELKRTSWRPGSLVVGSDGEPVVADLIRDGEVLTVYPRGAVGAIDSQAVLIREPAERYSDAARTQGVVDGLIIYSKLCTHMGCPLGLYQQSSGTLLCPCHQAAFDVLDRGRPVSGPARRPLPRLPFRRTDDGLLVASDDFSDAVGSGFWWRP